MSSAFCFGLRHSSPSACFCYRRLQHRPRAQLRRQRAVRLRQLDGGGSPRRSAVRLPLLARSEEGAQGLRHGGEGDVVAECAGRAGLRIDPVRRRVHERGAVEGLDGLLVLDASTRRRTLRRGLVFRGDGREHVGRAGHHHGRIRQPSRSTSRSRFTRRLTARPDRGPGLHTRRRAVRARQRWPSSSSRSPIGPAASLASGPSPPEGDRPCAEDGPRFAAARRRRRPSTSRRTRPSPPTRSSPTAERRAKIPTGDAALARRVVGHELRRDRPASTAKLRTVRSPRSTIARTLQIVANEDDTKVAMRPTVDVCARPTASSAGRAPARSPSGRSRRGRSCRSRSSDLDRPAAPSWRTSRSGVFGGSPLHVPPAATGEYCDLTQQQIAPLCPVGHRPTRSCRTGRAIERLAGGPLARRCCVSFVGAVDGTVLTYDPGEAAGRSRHALRRRDRELPDRRARHGEEPGPRSIRSTPPST